MIYHSALKEPLKIDGELDRYESGDSIVFYHDLTNGIHPDFYRVDVIYAEPAWRAGYKIFADRAGVPDSSYSAFQKYLANISNVILALGIPAYITMGSHMKKQLAPDHLIDIKLNGGKALLGIWNADPIQITTNLEAIQYVADHYQIALDFSCGYGNTAKVMKEHGKNFICSDLNKNCIYYIAKELMGYADR